MNSTIDHKTDDYGNALTWNQPTTKEPPIDASEENTLPLVFPLEALNSAQRRAVLAVSKTYQQDPALSGMVSLAGLAGSIGRGFKVLGASSHATYANLFVIAAAERAYGKGSSSSVLAALVRRNSEMQLEYRESEMPSLKADIAIAERELKDALMASKKGACDKARIQKLHLKIDSCAEGLKLPPSLYVGSATGAALWESLARNNEQLLSYSPEAGDLVRVAMGRYSKDDHGDFDLLLSGYTVEPISETRVGRGSKHLAHPCLSACWLIQPSLLTEILGNSEVLERGLAARCLYVVIPPTIIPFDDGLGLSLPASKMEEWDRVLNMALDHRDSHTVTISCDEDARNEFRAFHNETVEWRNTTLRDIQGEFGRARENAIRLALGQCVADAFEQGRSPSTLTIDHARRGIAIARFSIDQFLRRLSPVREEQRKGRLSKIIDLCRGRGGAITMNDLKNRNGFDEREVKILATAYPEQLNISVKEPTKKGGRPSTIVSLMPPSKLL